MSKRIVVIQAHPDPARGHFCHALAKAYIDAAREAGHRVDLVELAQLDIPFLVSQHEWEHEAAPASLRPAQALIGEADHYVFIYPLWLGDMPALLKAFLEQVYRPGFAFGDGAMGMTGKRPLKGKSARVFVTMGMPAFFYRWFYRAHSLKNLERNILRFIGLRPVRSAIIGNVAGKNAGERERWLARARKLGAAAG